LAHNPASPAPVFPPPSWWRVAWRAGWGDAHSQNSKPVSTTYNVYSNAGSGPINYATPVASGLSVLTWTSSALSFPGTWSFSVRAYDTVSGLEEQNLDCAISIILDSNGNDITNRPLPPTAIRAFAMAAGSIRVEWYYPPSAGLKAPTGFNVYAGTGGSPNYGSPAATVAFSTGIANTFVSNLAGFVDGTTYTIGVRAYNATAEESNTNTVTVTADATGPAAVGALAGTATSTT
jgi:hypothetical protein